MNEEESLGFRDADVAGFGATDVLIRGDRVVAVGRGCATAADTVIGCDGVAVLPGLHDHHIHLLATVAAARSIDCGPPAVRTRSQLAHALRLAATDVHGWIRGIGYDEVVAGDLDRAGLDALRRDVPVRIQHRSGALWVLNTPALEAVLPPSDLPGVERDTADRPTGRLWRLDRWLGAQLPTSQAAPDLAPLSRRLASVGVTGVTDATPDLTLAVRQALTGGGLAQRLTLLGDPHGGAPAKLVVADHDLPSWDVLVEAVLRRRPRPVAVHAVTRAALVLVLGVLDHVGVVCGDRIEHAAVATQELARWISRLGIAVATQPSFVMLRGDDYLARVEVDDRPHLWPFRSLLDAGVRVACSSDAPYGNIDPWASMATAVDRRSSGGRLLAVDEAVTVGEALDGYLGPADDPGGPARTIRPGVPADLIMLDRPRAAALADPSAVDVQATWIAGRKVWDSR